MIVLIRIQDALTSLYGLRIILILSAYFYMDMNCFRLVRVVSNWLPVWTRWRLMVLGWWLQMFSGGSGGFRWFLMISGGFVTVLVVTSLLPNSKEAYSDLSLKHYNKVFLLSMFLMKLQGWSSRYLLVQSQRCKHRNNVWNLFKVNNKDTWTTSLTLLWCLYC